MRTACCDPAAFRSWRDWCAVSCAPRPKRLAQDRVRCMKLRIGIIAALGLALALYLVMYVGFGAVFSAAVTVGWSGFAILCFYASGVFLLLGAAWYVLLPDSSPTRLWVFVWARMVRDAAAEVLPFSQLWRNRARRARGDPAG